jgi:ElaB/YqjD/DUF883 family membrane-anchored ribosome-binding protein
MPGRIMETQTDASTRLAECQRLISEYIRANPATTVGAAAVAGPLLGLLLARR